MELLARKSRICRPADRDKYAEAIGFFDRALAVDPQSAEAQGWLAENLAGRALDEMTETAAADICGSRAAISRLIDPN
jgi:hypothetical protein